MTAATAHDLTSAALATARRCARNAAKVGNDRMVARFELRAIRLERQLQEWCAHPALQASIRSERTGFVVRRSDGSAVLARIDLSSAQAAAVDAGFRVIDLTACGTFF